MLFPSQEKKLELLTRLKMLGVSTVEVRFSGGGDSGEIEDVTALDVNNSQIDISKEKMVWDVTKQILKDEKWVIETNEEKIEIGEILTNITENWLEETNHDWYNNEGGQGSMYIHFAESPPRFELEVGVNYTRTDEYNYTLTEDDESEEV